jgi:hypothetical protein
LASHNVPLFFGLVEQLVAHMTKTELGAMPQLTVGTAPSDNLWIAALDMLSADQALPPSDIRASVHRAFEAFAVKFKEKHCHRFLTLIVQWAFSEVDAPSKTTAADLHQSSPALAGVSRADRSVVNKRPRREAEDEDIGGKASAGHGGGDEGGDGDDQQEDDAAGSPVACQSLRRWIVALGLYHHLLGRLGGILAFSFTLFLRPVVAILTRFNTHGGQRGRRRAKGASSALIPAALDAALKTVLLMARAQHDSQEPAATAIPRDTFFAQPAVFNALCPALIQQLGNTCCLASPSDASLGYGYQVSHAVVPAVRAFFATLDSTKLYSRTQQELLKQLRSPDASVRRATLSAFRGIYADGGDMLASMAMAEVLPAIVEATEDSSDAVVEEARLLCNDLSAITGQDVLYAMS